MSINKNTIPLNCGYCENAFDAKIYSAKLGRVQKFCSVSCRIAHNNKHRIWSKESLKKASNSKIGIYAGVGNPNYKAAFSMFKCKECFVDFSVSRTNLKNGKIRGVYCSLKCRDIYRRKNGLSDIQKRLYKVFGRNISKSLRFGKNRCKWTTLLGYSLTDLKNHLESLFIDGMNWDNYGRYGWHMDHIKPASFFKYDSIEDPEFKKCWELSNLQPLWCTDNLKKGGNNRQKNIDMYGIKKV